MPELPEVETTREGVARAINKQTIKKIIIRQHQLRWPVPLEIQKILPKQKIQDITRRGKYLLVHFKLGTLIIHLGMSGSLRVFPKFCPAEKHDHIDLITSKDLCVRFTDPRRFGCWLWTSEDPTKHSLLKDLGPEPLTSQFTANYLFQKSRKRKVDIKAFIMNSKIVVGVGNIYVNEALFLARIHPQSPVNKITLAEYKNLVTAIKKVLRHAIQQGGTSLRNFMDTHGNPGSFKQRLNVYDRADLPCVRCKTKLKGIRTGQRSTYFCPTCQAKLF